MGHVIIQAELDCIVCCGVRQGKLLPMPYLMNKYLPLPFRELNKKYSVEIVRAVDRFIKFTAK